jgi:hypothetical protein
MEKVIDMSAPAHAVLTPAVLREKASQVRAFACHLPAYDEAVERLLAFAAELEASADLLATGKSELHSRSTCGGAERLRGSEA